MTNFEDLKTVVDLDGAVRFDPVMQTYIVRIPAAQFLDRAFESLYLELGSKLEKLEYDAVRDIYYHNYLQAESLEVVEASKVIIK